MSRPLVLTPEFVSDEHFANPPPQRYEGAVEPIPYLQFTAQMRWARRFFDIPVPHHKAARMPPHMLWRLAHLKAHDALNEYKAYVARPDLVRGSQAQLETLRRLDREHIGGLEFLVSYLGGAMHDSFVQNPPTLWEPPPLTDGERAIMYGNANDEDIMLVDAPENVPSTSYEWSDVLLRAHGDNKSRLVELAKGRIAIASALEGAAFDQCRHDAERLSSRPLNIAPVFQVFRRDAVWQP